MQSEEPAAVQSEESLAIRSETAVEESPADLFALVKDFDSIRGWLSHDEANCLFQLAASLKEGCILEIGSFQGRSTTALCAGSSIGAHKPVFAIEPHEEFVGAQGGKFGAKDRAAFFRNFVRTGLFPLVRLVNLSSGVVAHGWQQSIGLIFIDGDHRYRAVRRDFAAWRPFLLKGAPVVFDDAAQPGPSKLIQERVSAGDLEFVKTVGKMGVYRFLGESTTRQELRKIEGAPVRHVTTLDVAEKDIANGVYYGGHGSYLYQPITKCGCTSLKSLLLELEGLPVIENEWQRHQKKFNNFPGTEQLTPEERHAIFSGLTDTFKFVFVRNPYTRLLSVYADKIGRRHAHWVDQLRTWAEAHAFPLSEEISFSEFVHIVSSQEFDEMDPHWRPQYVEGRFQYIKFDFIGRFEMMQSDLLYVLERIAAPKIIFDKATQKHNVTGASASAWDDVSEDIRASFVRKFSVDFDTMRYPHKLR